MSEILIHYTRGGKVESAHRGDVAVVDIRGQVVFEIGQPERPMFWRSSAKPFQALPFVERGGADVFGITAEELAIMVSSHGGEPEHVAVVERILHKIGLSPADLACGIAAPMSSHAARELASHGLSPKTVHNACSGKHVGMLALAKMLNIPIEGYKELNHPVQQLMLAAVADSAGLSPERIELGIDGCGVPVFFLPLRNMAWAYARMALPEKGGWGEKESPIRAIRDAMAAYPYMVAGTRRLDTALMTITHGRIIAKLGSEAVYCLASASEGLGVAFKIEDGGYRALAPVTIGILKKLNLISIAEHAALLEQFPHILKNHCGDIIGTVEVII